MNSVNLIGNLTKDPELRTTPSGTSVASLRIAVNDRMKKDGEWVSVPYYFDVTVWDKQAENCASYLSRGKKVGVSGRLTWREWEAQDGTKRQAVEIVAQRIEFLTPKGEGGEQVAYAGGDSGGQEATPDFVPASSDDDIPF